MPFSKGVTIDQISGKPLPSYSYSSKYSFAHADFWKWLRRYVLDADPTKFANSRYLHPYFVEDLKKVTDANTAYKFVEKYGTNVLTDFVTGGIYRCNYTSSVIKTSNWRETTDVVKAGLEVNLSIVKLGASSETTTEEQIRLNEQNNTYSGRIHTIGGDTNGLSAEFSNENPPKITVDFGAWASTVDDSNSRVITINWDKAYPVYDYITDPTKKALVKAAVHQYIVDSQPNVISTVPFYRYLHDRSVDHFYTTWWNDTQGEGAWRFENVECYILDKPTTGAIPLYEFWNAKWVDHFLTTDPVSSWLGSGWTKTSDIKGYIYTTQKEGTVPLHQYWSERYKDHFFTVHYAPTEGNGEWKYEHIIGYVYPAN